MNVTLGSILFPERRKVTLDTRKGIHNKRKKQVNALKNQEQTSKQFTTRLLLDDETIGPNDFLTPFPTDEVRNTEQFWEYMERVFYPIDDRWIKILDLSARPTKIAPKETCIGIHFAYRWALVDLFDVEELFKLIGERNDIFKSSFDDDSLELNAQFDLNINHDSVSIESKILDYLLYLDLPMLESIGINSSVIQNSNDQIYKTPYNQNDHLNNPYLEEWKYLYQRLCLIEKEVDGMISNLVKSISNNINKDKSRRLLQRHQKKICKKFLVKVLHYHSMRQFVDSLEEVLYFDATRNLYLTTWDDGEAVRVAWITQDQLIQLLLFRPNSTESKYSVSIPNEYIPYAKSLNTSWFKYLLDSGLPIVNDTSNNKGENNIDEGNINIPKDGCIELSRYPLCHYCRRSCKRLNYSRCPSKLKPMNLNLNTNNNFSNSNQNQISTLTIVNSQSLSKSSNFNSTNSSSNVCFSRSLISWRVPKSHNCIENNDHSSPDEFNERNISLSSKLTNNSNLSYNVANIGNSQICNICTEFESGLDESMNDIEKNDIAISRAYSPNNCWRMYCSECILHNFSSVIKQKYSNGIVLRYYCPFCNGACNCERCLRNQQIRKIKNYLKTRFCGYLLQCSISSCVIQSEITWYDFLKSYGGDSFVNITENDLKENQMNTNNCGDLMNDLGEINENYVNIYNIANVSYINNITRRIFISENTHLGFLWLQANNISFQKPANSSSSKKANSCTNSNNNLGDSNKNISKNKSRNRSNSTIQKNRKQSIGTNINIANNNEINNLDNNLNSKIQSNFLSNQQNGKIGTGLTSNSKLTSNKQIKCSSSSNAPPSIHIPREVLNEPTNASGTSVLWSLRSILSNNVNKYHKECLNNLEKWKNIQEIYHKKRVELENYFNELYSKLNIMDDWIRSISFTETNKRFIMKKMPLLCWTTSIPSAKAFNFDDYPQLIPNDHIVDLLRHIQSFVNNGIVSEDLPTYPVLGDSILSDFNRTCNTSQKTTPSIKYIDKLNNSLNTPTSIMDFIFDTIPEIQNVTVKSLNNSSKDEYNRIQKNQRNSKKEKNNSKNVSKNCEINIENMELQVNSEFSDYSKLVCNSEQIPSIIEVGDSSNINVQMNKNGSLLNKNNIQNDSSQICLTSVNKQAMDSRISNIINKSNHKRSSFAFSGNTCANFEFYIQKNDSCEVDSHCNDRVDYKIGDSTQVINNNPVVSPSYQSCSRSYSNPDSSNFESNQQKNKRRKSSNDNANDILTPERKRELALKKKRERESIRRALKKNNLLAKSVKSEIFTDENNSYTLPKLNSDGFSSI